MWDVVLLEGVAGGRNIGRLVSSLEETIRSLLRIFGDRVALLGPSLCVVYQVLLLRQLVYTLEVLATCDLTGSKLVLKGEWGDISNNALVTRRPFSLPARPLKLAE